MSYNGEVIEGEHEAVVRDPRKDTKVVKRLPSQRPLRAQLVPCRYEVSHRCIFCVHSVLMIRSTMGTLRVRRRPRAFSSWESRP